VAVEALSGWIVEGVVRGETTLDAAVDEALRIVEPFAGVEVAAGGAGDRLSITVHPRDASAASDAETAARALFAGLAGLATRLSLRASG
jgi:3-deoxy-D-arabino-heptulosonate 7-phosphate (DAHP) synthase